MRRVLSLFGLFGLVPVVVGGIAWSGVASGSGGRDSGVDSEKRGGPIVVELFTSQGCSSCPPADRFLSELADREDLEVIPLSFHVDYWNHIGWTDPFSSKAWSERQRSYARAFDGNRVYTPQMVINGRWEGVGSRPSEIAPLLERARTQSAAYRLDLSTENDPRGGVSLSVNTHRFDPVAAAGRLELWMAVVESGFETPVERGENARRTLRNDCVVRRLERIGDSSGGSARIELDATWNRERLSVVAFLQDPETLRIHGASKLAFGS